jgi:hypothetical protein
MTKNIMLFPSNKADEPDAELAGKTKAGDIGVKRIAPAMEVHNFSG